MLKKIALMQLTSQVFFFFTLSLCICEILLGNMEIKKVEDQELGVKDCLLPENHPLQSQLKILFDDPKMFDSAQNLKEEGFDILGRVRRGFLVARHPLIKNYLIKKFQNSMPYKKQMANYLKRINGARTLLKFIKLNNLQHVVVPQKWLYPLPEQFSDPKTGKRTYVLIVDEIDICSGGKDPNGEVARRYYDIDFDILRELCIVAYYFKGLDSGLQNMPFTYQNKIAFIDTEHWQREKREDFLRYAMRYMSKDRREYALKVLKELQQQDKDKTKKTSLYF